MKRQLSRMLAVLMVAGLIITGINCGSGGGADINKFIPADTSIACSIDFQALQKLDLYKQLEKLFNEQIPNTPESQMAMAMIKGSGFDLAKDLKRITIAMWGKDFNLEEIKMAAVIEIVYNKEKLLTGLKTLNIPLNEELYQDVPTMPAGPILVAFLDDSHVAFGDPEKVKHIIDVFKGKKPGLDSNEAMAPFSDAAGRSHVLVLGVPIPDSMKKNLSVPTNIPIKLSKFKSFVFSVGLSDCEVVVSTGDPEGNANFASTFNAMKGMIGSMPAPNEEAEMSKKILKEAELDASGDELILRVPTDVLIPMAVKAAEENLKKDLDKGKLKSTMGDMRSIGIAIESYMTDHGNAPEGESMEALKEKLAPFYIKTLPLTDAWGNPFQYKYGTGDENDRYWIGSGGKDGVFNGWEQNGLYDLGQPENEGNDLILSNGEFSYGPKIN